MENATIYGAALLLSLLIALPALDYFNFKPFGDLRRGPLWDLVWSELGAVTVTYYCRGGGVAINGSTTAPTGAQAGFLQKQTATIAFGATADAQALFTHNWGLDASAPTYFEPEIMCFQTLGGTYSPSLTFDLSNTNVVKVNKAATAPPNSQVFGLPIAPMPGLERRR